MNSTMRIRTGLVILLAATLSAVVLSLVGCGKSEPVSSVTSSSSTSTPKIPATGPAISSNLKFDQLAFESPVKRIKKKNGLVFLEFAYADNDGKVYKCELPEAMSKGEYPPDEWIRIFNLYRRPEVIAQKKVTKKSSQAIGDFPFISPRPQEEQKPTQPTTTSQPAQIPSLPPPPMPPTTQPQPVNPRAVPSAAPRQFMPEPGT
ncbi:MAG: hypothetical protein QHI38_07075 [Armatimonadota bacterium]|nr:hypothetical protein [Armatimonadota bacterium]